MESNAGSKASNDDSLQAQFLEAMSRANISDLVLDKEDVFESENGRDNVEINCDDAPSLSRHHSKTTPGPVKVKEISSDSTVIRINYDDKKRQDDEGQEEEEESLGEAASRIMDRVVTRRQRAHLLGVLTNPGRGRTTRLVQMYERKIRSRR